MGDLGGVVAWCVELCGGVRGYPPARKVAGIERAWSGYPPGGGRIAPPSKRNVEPNHVDQNPKRYIKMIMYLNGGTVNRELCPWNKLERRNLALLGDGPHSEEG